MKHRLYCIAAVVITTLFAIPSFAQDTAKSPEEVRSKLVGAWRLAYSEDQGKDGKPVRLEETGIIMYTADGHMAVQIRTLNPNGAVGGGPVTYQQDGYEGYYGTYTVNEADHTVTHHVEGALVKSLIGQNLTRVYQFEGKQLILHSSRADEHWKICWERY
jgi:lipocalin-like protein